MNASLYTAKLSKIEWVKGLGKALSDSYPLTYNLGMFPLTIDRFVFIHIDFLYGSDLLIVTIYKCMMMKTFIINEEIGTSCFAMHLNGMNLHASLLLHSRCIYLCRERWALLPMYQFTSISELQPLVYELFHKHVHHSVFIIVYTDKAVRPCRNYTEQDAFIHASVKWRHCVCLFLHKCGLTGKWYFQYC